MKRTICGGAVLGFLAISGCSSLPSHSTDIKIEEAEKLKVTSSTMTMAAEKFGEPNKKISVPGSIDEEIWIYFRGKFKAIPRLSLVFDKSNGLLQELTWNVQPGDTEYNLAEAKKRYPNAHFSSHPSEQTNPHFIPDEIIYSDNNLGIEISYKEATTRVESITWINPKSRSIANKPKGVNPNVDWTP